MQHLIWNVNPVMLEIGSFKIHWYGILFATSFVIGLFILTWMYKREKKNADILNYLLLYTFIGAAVGARLVHCLFYEPNYYLANPLEILDIRKGGLASHGGMVGVLIALWFLTKYYKESYTWLIARFTIVGIFTAAAIRVGNFMNSEILGLPSNLPWAIVFQRVDTVPRHPVQLYEALAYLLIFILLLSIYLKAKASTSTKILPPLFLITLFGTRFFIEYAKTRQATYVTDLPLTTGQMLSIPFVIIGVIWLILSLRSNKVGA
ncbi:MAG: Prolipoprotein diacylglyceryl transferase (EC [uncultured Sulfurovum sp.]|uniref:Phosphatidylglycerol--prolipoprotein diacylglyceryl transferase n=1 Tax=uncultured Sulfurovum sp. TaxID=269237 RepID=A0A6S6S0A2_9BACT|nr:MAG: Prolipoprotein diacylglyceryl transferase (EC [uncultured Sulfurovum sp.]